MTCIVEGCNRKKATRSGYCVMHYKRWKRNGTPERVLAEYDDTDSCTHCSSTGGKLRRGLCHSCSIRYYRKGYPDRDRRANGEGAITNAGYKLVTNRGVREYEHRLITGAQKGEVVHHKDGNKLNNNPDNLHICSSQSEHMKIHHAKED